MVIKNLTNYIYLTLTGLALNFVPAKAQNESPSYFLKNSDLKRTSWFFEHSYFLTSNQGSTQLSDGTLAYQIAFTYHIKPVGKRALKGQEIALLPESFFTGEFLQQLRIEKHIMYQGFLFSHLGRHSFVNQDDVSYHNCDRVKLKDERQSAKSLSRDGKLKNSVTVLSVCNVDILAGIARVDISGNSDGRDFKIGFDYETSGSP